MSVLCAIIELLHRTNGISIAMHIGSGTLFDVVRLHVKYLDAFIDLQMIKQLRSITLGMHSELLSPTLRFVPLARSRSKQTADGCTRVNRVELGCIFIVLANT